MIRPRILSIPLLFGHLLCLHHVTALCNCGVALGKTYVRDEYYSSGKTILVRMGCNDEQMKTECLAAKREMEDFVTSLMEYIDDIYIRPSMDLINRMFVADKITKQQYDALREGLVRQRNAASEAVEDRIHPDCASGLWTETLYNKNATLKSTYEHWKRWSLTEIRDNGLCVSRHLESELLKLQGENTVDPELRIVAGPFSSELNAVLRVELGQDESKGLTPYTKRIMDKIAEQRDDSGEDVSGLGITTGKDFVHFLLLRAVVEPPDIRLPASELSLESQFDQGDLGQEKIKCFPLNASVIVAQDGAGDESVYSFKQLADLELGDDVVTGAGISCLAQKEHNPIQLSPVVDFAHRMDKHMAQFLNVAYYSKDGASIKTVTASSNHNILVGIYNEDTGTIEGHYKTFGVLHQSWDKGSSVYVRSGRNKWLAVQNVSVSKSNGYVAPVTEQGMMAIVPTETVAAVDPDRSGVVLDVGQVQNILSQSAQVSCFSTTPDTIGSWISTGKRRLWGPSPNQDGVGAGMVLDGMASLGYRLSQFAGHLVR